MRGSDGTGKRFSRAFIHIGMGKTGSTEIQHAYWASSACLDSEYSIHYPVEPVVFNIPSKRGNHTEPLLSMFHPQPETILSNILTGRGNALDAKNFAEELRATFERGFEKSDARDLLLSAEGVPTFPNQAVSALARWLKQWCDEIHIVACLRHPRDALSSHIQQRLWVGGTLDKMYRDPPQYKYSTLLPRLEKLFGAGRLHVYDFAEAVDDRSGLANQLLREFGLNVTLPGVTSKHSNSSMSQQAALLVDALNRRYPVVLDGCRNPKHSGTALRLASLVRGAKFQAPLSVYAILDQRAESHLEWLVAQYGLQLRIRLRLIAEPAAYDEAWIERKAGMLYVLGRSLQLLGRLRLPRVSSSIVQR